MKTCKYCNKSDDESAFVKNAYICKECFNESQRKKYLEKMGYNPNEVKVCSKCEFTGNSTLFHTGSNVCKKCNKDKVCRVCGFFGDADLFKFQENICNVCENARKAKYNKENPEKVKEARSKHYYKNLEAQRLKCKRFRENNPEWFKEWYRTPTGRASVDKRNARRRELGYNPINEWFEGSEAHHLRLKNNSDAVMYIPKELHRSISHNGYTGRNMKEINRLCLKWYTENVSEEMQDVFVKETLLREYS